MFFYLFLVALSLVAFSGVTMGLISEGRRGHARFSAIAALMSLIWPVTILVFLLWAVSGVGKERAK